MSEPAGTTPTLLSSLDRLPSWVRVIALAVTGILLLFAMGVVAGLASASIEHGEVRPRGLIAGLLAMAGAAPLAWVGWRLSSYWRRPGRSNYERRHTRMMLVLLVSGLPLGLLLGMAGDGEPHEVLFGNSPLDPLIAGLAAATLVVVLAGTLVLYHRTIDDHEQQAYLWANSLAFYFLALALPAAWLLARGGLIPPIGIGSAMLILLAATVINLAVWAWLKFR